LYKKNGVCKNFKCFHNLKSSNSFKKISDK
jgi:hypothetical protein